MHEASVSLIREKGYEAVSVTEVLERANVGRSTFYVHYAGKDELLGSAIRDLMFPVPSRSLPSCGWQAGLLDFSLPVFEYIGRHLSSAGTGTAFEPKGWAIVHEQLMGVLTASIASEAPRKLQVRWKSTPRMSTEFIAKYVASTFVFVLNWWLTERERISPREADDLFRTLVAPTLTEALE